MGLIAILKCEHIFQMKQTSFPGSIHSRLDYAVCSKCGYMPGDEEPEEITEMFLVSFKKKKRLFINSTKAEIFIKFFKEACPNEPIKMKRIKIEKDAILGHWPKYHISKELIK
jgi:hypothetical protein